MKIQNKKRNIKEKVFSYKSCKLLTIKALLFVMMVFLIVFNASAQEQKISLKLKEKQLSQVLTEIESKSGTTFLVRSSDVDLKQTVSIDVVNKSVEEILSILFKNNGIKYEIKGKSISIFVPQKSPIIREEPTNKSKVPKKVSGIVLDETNQPIIGANVSFTGTSVGTITDINGYFTINIEDNSTLKISYIGYDSKFVKAENSMLKISLVPSLQTLEEVVVVGYGQQKKASVVGAIANTSNKELSRAGGVANLAQAMTGNITGVTTLQVSGRPGEEDPQIFIRGKSTWNGGGPYILVDGVERKMNDLDISEVESISVLKDASATAVFGVKGANGVILITTKRGVKGKPQLSVSANSTIKVPTKLVDKLDAYDTYMVKNDAIEREVVLSEGMWSDYTPHTIVNRYRNQNSLKYPEAYPNVDWQKESFKEYTTDSRVNLNLVGGTDFVKYFTTVSYLNQSDIYNNRDNGRGYDTGFGYSRFNSRTNLDFNLTKSTSLKVNLAGVYGIVKGPSDSYTETTMVTYLSGQYSLPPNAYLPQYKDGSWGKSPNTDSYMANSIAYIANRGQEVNTRTDLTSDITLNQKLDFLTKGLEFNVNLSYDNHFETSGGITERESTYLTKYIYPEIEDIAEGEDPNKYIIIEPSAGVNQYDWSKKPWSLKNETGSGTPLNNLKRRLFYQLQLNFNRKFDKHDIFATGVFNREQYSTGSEFPHFREDWVFRTTYNYDSKYFAEFNGAYNGSERFGPNYRYQFFPSAAVGWTLSNESFLTKYNWLDKLKLRYSYGMIGDDGGTAQRWLYNSQWSYNLNLYTGDYANLASPYTIYSENSVGNPNIQWETAIKTNIGFEFAVFKNLFSGNIEYFTENRSDILVDGKSRVVPDYYGATPTTANIGQVKKNGVEIELKFSKRINNVNYWSNFSWTNAIDKVIKYEDPILKDAHLKSEGYQIGQSRTLISTGYLNNWDDIYSSTQLNINDVNKLPGDYRIIDFDADGKIDNTLDLTPYGFSDRPQNNFSSIFGIDFNQFSFMIQFYGVTNVMRYVPFNNFVNNTDIAYEHTMDHWWKGNTEATSFLPRCKTEATSSRNYFLYDASYLRLKTAEIAYNFNNKQVKMLGLSSLRCYINGQNLIYWSKLPDDREIGWNRAGAYPNFSRINFGIDFKF